MNNNWIREANFYHIYPLGFAGAPRYNEGEKTAGNRILKVMDWIPHMKDMGINAIYFGPIFQSKEHGYDTSDYYTIDSRLGSNEDFKQVCRALKENGIRVVLDGVFNHVGRDFWAFKDLLYKQQGSEYIDWFSNIRFNQRNAEGDNFVYDTWEGYTGLVKLNLKNNKVCEHLLGAVRLWIEQFGIDGLRLDVADCVDKDFLRRLRSFTKELKDDFWLMGEMIHGDYTTLANDSMLDATTNYECYKGMFSSHNDKNYFEIAHSYKRQFGEGGVYKNLCLYNFVDNHDVDRLASVIKDKQDIKNTYTLLYMMPGVPSIYYGSEWGIEGVKSNGSDGAIRPCIDINNNSNRDYDLEAHIKYLVGVRANSNAIKYGQYEEIMVKNEQLVFARCCDNEIKIIALNVANAPVKLNFSYRGQRYSVSIMPHQSVIIG